MTRMKTALVLACLTAATAASAQAFAQTRAVKATVNSGIIRLSIIPTFGANAVVIGDSAFQAKDAHHTEIDVLKFYISRIQFLKNGAVVLEEERSFHLINAAAQASFHIAIPNKRNVPFDAVRFCLGIDSLTSVSGAMGGDLDPTKGMYWTWQSGYINLKCEGKSNLREARSSARNKEFQLHLGGYREPFSCLQVLSFNVQNAETIAVQFDIEAFLSQTDVAQHHHIMSPSPDAVRLSAVAAQAFRIVLSNSTK